jgi:hypothetical protein
VTGEAYYSAERYLELFGRLSQSGAVSLRSGVRGWLVGNIRQAFRGCTSHPESHVAIVLVGGQFGGQQRPTPKPAARSIEKTGEGGIRTHGTINRTTFEF